MVAIGGMTGAVLRHLVSEIVTMDDFPAGTLTVNVLGSFVLAVVTFGGAGNTTVLVVGTGACGAFTTFSSFSYDVVTLWERDRRLVAAGYATANLVGALSVVMLVGFFLPNM
nr:fluoride efflux transporter CrcB [Haloplanus sp. XH21]